MAHVKIEDSADHETVLDKAYDLLKDRFGFYFTTLQVEKTCRAPEEAKVIDFTGNKDDGKT